mmetsp:Transcript_11803/g.35826  ORF Transcript_11803/g.35826 Transcript_11803/m.35826 type:complete len:257 (-) Transcript_11803:48-818(-)
MLRRIALSAPLRQAPALLCRGVVTVVKKPAQPTHTVVQGVREVLKGAEAKPRKFVESVDIALVLGVDPRKAAEMVRGKALLPHGTGKKVRVAVFAGPQHEEAAKAAGADVVGLEELTESIQAGDVDFQRVLATPDAVSEAKKVARILGPRGLMPNPKQGTVTEDIAQAVQDAKAGEVLFRTKKTPEIVAGIGKVNFSEEALLDNVRAFMQAIHGAKPDAAKGTYIKGAVLSSTMGKGVRLQVETVNPNHSRFMLDR